jgi:hypothetical protein
MDTDSITERVREEKRRLLLVLVLGCAVTFAGIVVADVSYTSEWDDGASTQALAWDEQDRLGFYSNGSDDTKIRIRERGGSNVTTVSLNAASIDAVYASGEGYAVVGASGGEVYAIADDGSINWSVSPGASGDEMLTAYDSLNDTIWVGAVDLNSGTDKGTLYELDASNGTTIRSISLSGQRLRDITFDAESNSLYAAEQDRLTKVGESGTVTNVNTDFVVTVQLTQERIYYWNSSGKVVALYKNETKAFERTDSPSTGRPGIGANDANDYLYYDNGSDIVVVGPDNTTVGVLSGEKATDNILAFNDSDGTVGVFKYSNGNQRVAYLSTNTSSTAGTIGVGEGEQLRIETREYLDHNTTVPFRVYYNDSGTWVNVTENATVTVRDPEVVSVDQQAATMTSTDNTSINQITFVNASYESASASKEVVVANETVENIDILPPLQKWTATIGDDNSLVIVIATAIGAAIAFFASSLAGLAAFPVIVTAAWVAGYTATHTLLAAMLMSIFVGLNVAQVVEYRG